MTCRESLKSLGALGGASMPPATEPAPVAGGVTNLAAAILVSAVFALGIIGGQPAHAENADSTAPLRPERTTFTNSEITDGFFKLAFGAELQLGRRVERIRKFDEPVRAFIVAPDGSARRAQIATVVADIRARVDHLDLAITDDPKTANLFVFLVPNREFGRTIRALYGREKARQIARSLDPECLSGIRKDPQYRIQRADVIIPTEVKDSAFLNCAYEELLQALGPINDSRSVTWSMFNDDVDMGYFDVYDQYILNILYDPKIRPGMTKEEAGNVLPEILPTVRARIDLARCEARSFAMTVVPARDERCGGATPELSAARE